EPQLDDRVMQWHLAPGRAALDLDLAMHQVKNPDTLLLSNMFDLKLTYLFAAHQLVSGEQGQPVERVTYDHLAGVVVEVFAFAAEIDRMGEKQLDLVSGISWPFLMLFQPAWSAPRERSGCIVSA